MINKVEEQAVQLKEQEIALQEASSERDVAQTALESLQRAYDRESQEYEHRMRELAEKHGDAMRQLHARIDEERRRAEAAQAMAASIEKKFMLDLETEKDTLEARHTAQMEELTRRFDERQLKLEEAKKEEIRRLEEEWTDKARKAMEKKREQWKQKVKDARAELQVKKNKLQERVKAFEARMEEAVAAKAAAKDREEEMEERLAAMSREKEDLQRQKDLLQKAEKQVQRKERVLQERLDSLREQFSAKLEAELQKMEQEYKRKLASELKSRKATMQEMLQKLQKEVEQEAAKVDEQHTAELRAQKEKYEAELTRLKEGVSEVEAIKKEALQMRKKHAADLKRVTAQHETQLKALQSQIAELKQAKSVEKLGEELGGLLEALHTAGSLTPNLRHIRDRTTGDPVDPDSLGDGDEVALQYLSVMAQLRAAGAPGRVRLHEILEEYNGGRWDYTSVEEMRADIKEVQAHIEDLVLEQGVDMSDERALTPLQQLAERVLATEKQYPEGTPMHQHVKKFDDEMAEWYTQLEIQAGAAKTQEEDELKKVKRGVYLMRMSFAMGAFSEMGMPLPEDKKLAMKWGNELEELQKFVEQVKSPAAQMELRKMADESNRARRSERTLRALRLIINGGDPEAGLPEPEAAVQKMAQRVWWKLQQASEEVEDEAVDMDPVTSEEVDGSSLAFIALKAWFPTYWEVALLALSKSPHSVDARETARHLLACMQLLSLTGKQYNVQFGMRTWEEVQGEVRELQLKYFSQESHTARVLRSWMNTAVKDAPEVPAVPEWQQPPPVEDTKLYEAYALVAGVAKRTFLPTQVADRQAERCMLAYRRTLSDPSSEARKSRLRFAMRPDLTPQTAKDALRALQYVYKTERSQGMDSALRASLTFIASWADTDMDAPIMQVAEMREEIQELAKAQGVTLHFGSYD